MKKSALAAAASASAICAMAFSVPAHAQADPFIGQVALFTYTFCPRGWDETDGQLISIAQNTALFSLLGTNYGGNGQTTFGLPDLRGRSAVHFGQGPGLSNIQLGQVGGTESVTLTINNMPSHSHVALMRVSRDPGNQAIPGRNYLGQLPVGTNGYFDGATPAFYLKSDAIRVDNTGGGQPFGNRDPYLGLRYCIALEGIYPSRN